jgi:hypothetical protein
MSNEPKFKVGDKVQRRPDGETGVILEVMIEKHPTEPIERFVYRAEFIGQVHIYINCDLELADNG